MARLEHDPDVVHRRRWAILGALNLSLVIVVAGNSSLNVTLPTIVRDLGATSSELQWIVDAYALVFAGLLLPMGALGDRFGRKGMLQGGLGVFAAGAIAATFATEPWHLIATRGVMGVGAAMIMPATLSIITNVFPPEERARAIAVWAGFAGAGAAIGPPVSGFLLEHFWFGSVFFINVPIIALALAGGLLLVPTSRDPRGRPLDPVGATLSMLGLAVLLYGIIEAPDRGWTDPLVLAGFLVGGGLLAWFASWERRAEHPMLPIDQFRDPRFTMGSIAVAITFFVMLGLFFVATQYLQFVLGYSPLGAGLATLPMAGMMIVSAPRSAALSVRFGRNRVVGGGLLIIAAGMVIMSTLSPGSNYPHLLVALLLFGTGMGLAMAPSTGAIMESMPLSKAGVGSAVNDTTREVGGSLGIAVLGSILSAGYRAHLDVDLSRAPAEAAAAVRESIGAALAVAPNAPPPFDVEVADAARNAFTDSMGTVFLVAAALAVVGALLVLRFMPAGGEVVTHERVPEEPART